MFQELRESSIKVFLEFGPRQSHLHQMGIHNEIDIEMRKEEFVILFAPHKVFFHTGEVLLDQNDPMIGIRALMNKEGATMKHLQ